MQETPTIKPSKKARSPVDVARIATGQVDEKPEKSTMLEVKRK